MKNKWLLRFQEKHGTCTDRADTVTMSGMSVPTSPLSGENDTVIEPDNAHVGTDKADTLTVSGMSVRTLSVARENDMVIEQDNAQVRTDKADIVTMSGMSVCDQGDLGQNSRLNLPTDFSSTLPSLVDDYEERLAIAEYDGGQNAMQAHRIAYEGAIMAILNASPLDDLVTPDTDWLKDRIKSAGDYLMTQGIVQPS